MQTEARGRARELSPGPFLLNGLNYQRKLSSGYLLGFYLAVRRSVGGNNRWERCRVINSRRGERNFSGQGEEGGVLKTKLDRKREGA